MKKVDVTNGPGPRIDLRLTKVRFYHFEYFFVAGPQDTIYK